MQLLSFWSRMLAMLGAGALLTATQAQANPCPKESKDRWFTYSLDANYCVLSGVEGDAPEATQDRYYNIYCPGRMTKSDAVAVGRALTSGALKISSNRIPGDYALPYHLVPTVLGEGTQYTEASIAHLGHYGCQRPGEPNAVATHFKLHVIASPNALEIAKHAVLKNESGSLAIGHSYDREYFLKVRIKKVAAAHMPEAVTQAAMNRDLPLRSKLKTKKARLCILESTDIQCAPCNTSDKLIARTWIVEEGRACPPDTKFWLEGTYSSSYRNGYPNPMP